MENPYKVHVFCPDCAKGYWVGAPQDRNGFFHCRCCGARIRVQAQKESAGTGVFQSGTDADKKSTGPNKDNKLPGPDTIDNFTVVIPDGTEIPRTAEISEPKSIVLNKTRVSAAAVFILSVIAVFLVFGPFRDRYPFAGRFDASLTPDLPCVCSKKAEDTEIDLVAASQKANEINVKTQKDDTHQAKSDRDHPHTSSPPVRQIGLVNISAGGDVRVTTQDGHGAAPEREEGKSVPDITQKKQEAHTPGLIESELSVPEPEADDAYRPGARDKEKKIPDKTCSRKDIYGGETKQQRRRGSRKSYDVVLKEAEIHKKDPNGSVSGIAENVERDSTEDFSGYAETEDIFALDQAKRRIDLESTITVSDFAYANRHPNSDTDNLKEVRGLFELSIPVKGQLILVGIEGSIRHWASEVREELVLREGYFEYRPKNCGFFLTDMVLRAGMQNFSWGSGVMYNPTDNLSPWNVVDPFDAQRRGIPSVKLSLSSGLHMLDLVYIATFMPTRLPDIGERFFIYNPKSIPNPAFPAAGPPTLDLHYGKINKSFKPPLDLDSYQIGARYSASIRGWDFALSYFRGYEHTPVFEGVPVNMDVYNGRSDIIVNYIYPEEQVLGVDVSGYAGMLGLHFESAFFDMKDTGHDVGIGDKDYISMIGGMEYSFNDLIGTHDFRVSMEYAREIIKDEDYRIYINRIYRNSLLFRLKHDVNYKLSGELCFVYNFNTEGNYISLGYDYQYSDHVKFSAGIDLFGGPENTFFGAYDDNDRLVLSMKLLY